MNRKGAMVAGIFALIFVPGTIPAYIALKTAKYRKKKTYSKRVRGIIPINYL